MLPQEWTAAQVHTWELAGVSPVSCLLGTTEETDEDLYSTEAGGSQVSLAHSTALSPRTLCQSQGMMAHLNLPFRQSLAKLPSQALNVVFLSKTSNRAPL